MNTTTKPIHPFSKNPVSGYPLTHGELCALAEYWWDIAFDHGIWWVLSGTVGASEMREHDHASDRLDLIAKLLGEDEVGRIRNEIEARWRRKLGEEQWTAYEEGRSIYRDEPEERTGRREARANAKRK
jgi:hypothetical protein